LFAPKTNTQTTSAKNSLFGGESDAFVQPKLSVGQPGDRYEVEADKAADQIVARDQQQTPSFISPTPAIQRQTDEDVQKQELENEIQQKPVVDPISPGVQLKPLIQQQTEEEIQQKCAECGQEETLQRKPQGQQAVSGSVENQLVSSKGGGRPMSGETRSSMESGFGADFGNVRIHTDSNAVQMNKSLGAQAFTSGNDIYFNEGKYNPNSSSGKHLLAHELTHTIQQGGSGAMAQAKIQMMPDWVNSAAGWVGDTASGVANGVADGAAWVGGQVADGAAWVGDQVADGAEWVGDQISAAATWVMDGINGAINSGTDFLNEKWDQVKEFGTSSFDDIKNGFGSLVSYITSPFNSLMTAMTDFNSDLLEGTWNMLKSGGDALMAGINNLVQGVLNTGEAMWSSVTGFINGIFENINSFFNNSGFGMLPESIQSGIRSAFSGLQSLWDNITSFWNDLWTRLTSFGQEIIDGAMNFVENVINYGIAGVISMMKKLKEMYDYIMVVAADPMGALEPHLQAVADKLDAEAPGESESIGMKMANEFSGGQAAAGDNGVIQREEIAGEERSTTNLAELIKGIFFYIKQAFDRFDFLAMIKQTIYNTYHPVGLWNAIKAEFTTLVYDEWAETANAMYTPRNFFESPLGCMQDIWTNYLLILDFPNALHRRLNNVLGLLMGWATIIVVLLAGAAGAAGGTIAGGLTGVPGFFAGATAGMAIMTTVGLALSLSVMAAERESVKLNMQRLFTALQTCEKRQIDIMSAVTSFITMAVTAVIAILMMLLSALLKQISEILKAPLKKPVPIPTDPIPDPIPIRPPVREPVPIRPPAREPIPIRPQPGPSHPSQPRVPIAAKFEDGTDGNLVAQRLEDDSESNEMQTKKEQNAHAESPVAVQMSRRNDRDPDACKIENPDRTKVFMENHADGDKPGYVEANPLTSLEGVGKHEKGTPPNEDPAGWKLVDLYKYFEAYIDPTKPKGSGRLTPIDTDADREHARKNKYKIVRTTNWIRFHILNQKLHGAGMFFNLLSSSNDDNGKYHSKIENKLKPRVLDHGETFYFHAKVDYRSKDNMKKVNEIYEDNAEEIGQLYEQIPAKITLNAYRMKKDKNGVYHKHNAPNATLFSNEGFTFSDDIDVSVEPGAREVIIMKSGMRTHRRLGIHNRLTVILKELKDGGVSNVKELVDGFFMRDVATSLDTGIGYVDILFGALKQANDQYEIRLFEGGVGANELSELERKIFELVDIEYKHTGDLVYQPYQDSNHGKTKDEVKKYQDGLDPQKEFDIESIRFKINKPSKTGLWNAVKPTGRKPLKPQQNHFILKDLESP